MTEWRSIPGYVSTYQISEAGEVLSLPRNTTRGGVLRASVGKRGYLSVNLTQDGKSRTYEVHRLVASAFMGPRPEGMEVRHLDGDPLNPSVTNLAYGTRSANVRDKRRHGTDHNVNKTHCPSGHPYAGDNLLTIPSRPTARYCRTCNIAQKAAS